MTESGGSPLCPRCDQQTYEVHGVPHCPLHGELDSLPVADGGGDGDR